MTRLLRVLHLEDNPNDAEIIRDRLEREHVPCDIVLTTSRSQYEAALTGETFDLIISDYNVPGYSGVTALRAAQSAQPDVPVILISGTVGEDEAVKCLHIGATDYLLKSSLDRLAPAVERAIREAEMKQTRKRAELSLRERELALRASEERTNFALGAARMGVWEIEIATNRMTWSSTMPLLFGLTPASAPRTTHDFYQLISPDDRRAVRSMVDHAITGERADAVEFRAVWPDGSVHWVNGRAQVWHDQDDVPVRLIGVAMDIEDRKLLEEQLRQAHKLEAVGQLAGGVAHDFNNVLTVILGFSELLLMAMPIDAPEREEVLEIKKAGTRAAGLTRQLLAFSRKQILQPEVLDLNVLIRSMEPMLRLLIVEHVEFSVSLDAVDACIRMDRTQVEQILVNLAVNAADAMPLGGRLSMATSIVTLGDADEHRHLAVRPGVHVLLEVRDTGVGMSADVIQHIFEPFFTTKEVGKGTGLGLATVHGIVKQSDGDISVESEPGHGTAFRVYLPQILDEAPIVAPEERIVVDDTLSRCVETILLVEDDVGVRLLTRLTLERAGYHVLEAGDPKIAAELASAYVAPIDLMLSDVIMPESGGAPLLEILAAARPAIRAVYMSGYADEAIRHVLLPDGMPFMQKPFTPESLIRKVREVLDAPRTVTLSPSWKAEAPSGTAVPAEAPLPDRLAERDQPQFPKGTVLLVDDNERYRSMLTRYMKSLGFYCLQANSGEEALVHLAATPDITLVLSDVAMPGMDGLTLLGTIRQRWPDTAVLMITGIGEPDIVERCLLYGAMDVIEKPFNLHELQRRVLDVLERRRLHLGLGQTRVIRD